ncbi:MAG: PD-(D/E)XK nuclease family protein [Bdellovibrionales bacterium]|nr:PD-(D/E)XK nuclease family protein [Bdellovibrionales bacterium]
MLEFITTLDTKAKKKILKNFTPKDSLWVTSDVKSRLFIIAQLTNKQSPYKSNILRATDCWSQWLSAAYPEFSIIPRSFLILIYQKWAQNRTQEWQTRKETGSLLCQYMEALAHLLKHPLRDNLIEEWKAATVKASTDLHWSRWYHLASDFQSYLEQQKIIESSWAGAFLLDNIPFKHIPFKEVIFDLGFNINRWEGELIQQLATKINTKVLVPFFIENTYQNEIYSIYNRLYKTDQVSPSLRRPVCKFQINTQPVSKNIKLKKFITPLAEVKDISSWVKNLLNKGTKPNRICVLAPHIEDYWTCLKSYFKREDIIVNKGESVSLSSIPIVQLWFAKMQTHLSILKYENLETIYSYENRDVHFNQLKSDFYHIKKIENGPSEIYIKNKLKNINEEVTADTFMKWALEFLPQKKNVPIAIQKAIKKCIDNFSQTTKITKQHLKWPSWLHLLKSFINKSEIEIQAGHPKGINCLSFNAIGWLESDFIYIAGLSEQNIKIHNFISSLSTDSIMKNLGFFIKSESVDKWEQVINYFIQQKNKEFILSFSSTNFSGTPLNPSCLWLEKAIEYKKDINHLDTSGMTLWDQKQRQSSIRDIMSHNPEQQAQWKCVEQSIHEDLGYKTITPFAQQRVKMLSPSSLEDYIKCPFIFTAKHLFYLWDGPTRDMDIPISEKGSIVHKLFEILKCKNNGFLFESDGKIIPDEYILKIIEDIKTSKKFKKQINKIHPVIWEKQKTWLLNRALIFLEKEKIKKHLFENYKTIACEKKYNCYWNFKTASPDSKGDIIFKGKIDRIDSNNQSYQIIDYKNSLPTGSVAPSWSSQDCFQMAFYAQVLERGLTNLPPLPVQSALYLSYKSFEHQGLALKKPPYIQLLGSSKKKSLISEELKQKIFTSVNKKANSFILNIHKGYFPAHPKTKTLCTKCKWRKICRASHLN